MNNAQAALIAACSQSNWLTDRSAREVILATAAAYEEYLDERDRARAQDVNLISPPPLREKP